MPVEELAAFGEEAYDEINEVFSKDWDSAEKHYEETEKIMKKHSLNFLDQVFQLRASEFEDVDEEWEDADDVLDDDEYEYEYGQGDEEDEDSEDEL